MFQIKGQEEEERKLKVLASDVNGTNVFRFPFRSSASLSSMEIMSREMERNKTQRDSVQPK